MSAVEEMAYTPTLEVRAAKLVDVSFPRRIIELVVMPYEETTLVPVEGRVVEEVVSRGAFDGIERRRPGSVKVNKDHIVRVDSTIGSAVRFDPGDQRGLVAEVRIAKGEDAVLDKAADGILEASAGFMLKTLRGSSRVDPDAAVWETRSRRRLKKLWLHHIAMTPDPAYSGAQVLSVRVGDSEPPPGATRVETPHLDRLRAELLAERYACLNA